MTVKVIILLQPGITMGRKHLPMAVNIDPFSLGLLEQFFQVLQIVPGYQDRLTLLVAKRYLGGYRMPIYTRVTGIQKCHGIYGCFTALEGEADPIVQAEVVALNGGEPFMDKGIYPVIFLAQDLGVIRIGVIPKRTVCLRERMSSLSAG